MSGANLAQGDIGRSSLLPGKPPVLRWYECLKTIAPDSHPPPKEALQAGWEAHSNIESMFPEFPRESLRQYSDPTLPFVIQYRPDLYDPLSKTVYDIKSQRWVIQHLSYCVAQLSGYVHFLGAKHGAFLLYRTSHQDGGKRTINGPWPWTPPFLYDWEYLRNVAIESYRMLAREKA